MARIGAERTGTMVPVLDPKGDKKTTLCALAREGFPEMNRTNPDPDLLPTIEPFQMGRFATAPIAPMTRGVWIRLAKRRVSPR